MHSMTLLGASWDVWSDVAASNIYQFNQKSKIIILLRNPIERAFSHYKMALDKDKLKKGITTVSAGNHAIAASYAANLFNIRNKIFIGPRYFHSFCGAVGCLVNKKSAKTMSDFLPTSLLADDWDHFYELGLKIAYTNPMIIRENWTKVSSTMNHTNKSWTYKKSDYLIIKFLLYIRKRIYGLCRLVILFLKNKFK